MKGLTFTLGELAGRVTGGNLAAMAKMLNDAGAAPRLDENDPDPGATVDRVTVIDLATERAGDRVGRLLGAVLGETIGEAKPWAMTGDYFTLGDPARSATGGNILTMAKVLNDAGATPRLDENDPDPGATVTRDTVIDLFAQRTGDIVGWRLGTLLGETMGEAEP